MKFHWMDSRMNIPIAEMQKVSNLLDEICIDSVLLTFHSGAEDNWIKAAAALNNKHDLKYMIAIRPYHLSPQYCAMMIEGFNAIGKNRLILNFVAGDVQNRPEEQSQKDVFGNTENLQTIEDRKKFVRDFVSELTKSPVITNMPEFVFSGYSEYTIETAELYNGIGLAMYDDYIKHKDLFKNLKRKMVSVKVFIRETDDMAEIELDRLITRQREKDFTIYGSEETVFSKFLKMKEDGITDILAHNHYNDIESYRIYDVIKKITVGRDSQ